jgi:hypothetical protein
MTLSVALYLLDTDAVIDFFKGFPSSVGLSSDSFKKARLCVPAPWSWPRCMQDSTQPSEVEERNCSGRCGFS